MRKYPLGLAIVAGLPLALFARGDDPKPGPEPVQAEVASKPRAWTTAVEPKALSPQVKKGLDWLVERQQEGGGWGQGEESQAMRGGGNAALKDQPNVADTCIAALALIRSGSTPTEGPYKSALAKAVGYVRGQVEASKAETLSVTSVNGTRVQAKLGPNIDTFLASMLLAEVKGHMPEGDNKPVDLALDKVLDKIKRHQKDDGSFEGGGWAPVLAQAMCGKGINRAKQAGSRVSDLSLARADNGAKAQASESFAAASKPLEVASAAPISKSSGDKLSEAPVTGTAGGVTLAEASLGAVEATRTAPSGRYAGRAGKGSAGVELYSKAATLGVLSDSENTNKAKVEGLKKSLKSAKDEPTRARLHVEIEGIEEVTKLQERARDEVIARLDDKQFLAGFGSNGGEEFLSYMTIGESLVVKGGKAWETWDASMTQNLNRVQNEDGSWSGHHCITGRTFCTSSALLVLMSDRTPVPVAADAPKTEN